MREKIAADITSITLNTATFSGVVVKPTMINFFFGKNGVGKTTIAKAILNGTGLSWEPGRSFADYEILLYNQDFIDSNFSQYEELPGVFTVNEVNIEIQKEVKALSLEKRAAEDEASFAGSDYDKKRTELERTKAAFADTLWSETREIRETFGETQKGKKRKDAFRDEVLRYPDGVKHDPAELKRLYDTAYDPRSRAYPFIPPVDCGELPVSELLEKRIVSSSDTGFARFVTAIQATDWVRRGHELFPTTPDCKCPYCQQTLPDTFEADIAACFDEQYRSEMQALKDYREKYRSLALERWEKLRSGCSDLPPDADIQPYRDQIDLFIATVKLNLQRIDEKIKEPAQCVKLEPVAEILKAAQKAAGPVNQRIQENNDIVSDIPGKQKECCRKTWELIVFSQQKIITGYRNSVASMNLELDVLQNRKRAAEERAETADEQITELNKKTVNTEETIRGMNTLLQDSGFQGFQLRAKEGTENVYEVVRQDGSIAVNLSEGERNFIAFLYFYHKVRGTASPDGRMPEKIVVIDDPVSSMDSGALFLVGALVREMVEICRNNVVYEDRQVPGDYIRQIFILTHNAYFHREITYNQEKRYECVSFFLVNKADNVSTVTLCVREDPMTPTQKQNYNPVQNSYAALWSEYREVHSSITVLNVIRRILEYYFLQFCGYDGTDIRQVILVNNKGRFVTELEDGQTDYTKYHIADAMLQYLSTSSTRFTDGLNYTEDCTDVEHCRQTFRLIFECMNQLQHYQMMMGEQ